MPVILLEGAYEFEREATARMIRRNAYGALLAGAAGQFFGNNPIWHFTGPGIFNADRSWQEALGSPGARSMTVMKKLFDRLPWPHLQPDREKRIALKPESYASSLPDGTLSVIYGDADGFAVAKQAVGQGRKAIWFDPVSGMFADAGPPKIEGTVATYMPAQAKTRAGNRLAFADRQHRAPALHPKGVGDTPFSPFINACPNRTCLRSSRRSRPPSLTCIYQSLRSRT